MSDEPQTWAERLARSRWGEGGRGWVEHLYYPTRTRVRLEIGFADLPTGTDLGRLVAGKSLGPYVFESDRGAQTAQLQAPRRRIVVQKEAFVYYAELRAERDAPEHAVAVDGGVQDGILNFMQEALSSYVAHVAIGYYSDSPFDDGQTLWEGDAARRKLRSIVEDDPSLAPRGTFWP